MKTITVKEAAKLFDVPVTTIHNWSSQGRIRTVHAGSAGNASVSGVSGKLMYHNLVSVGDVNNLAALYHAQRVSEGRKMPRNLTSAQIKRARKRRKAARKSVIIWKDVA